VHLEPVVATEMAEMLTFISHWLAGPDNAVLAASFGRVIGTDGYDLTEFRRPGPLHLPARPRRRRTTLRPRGDVNALAHTARWTPLPVRTDARTSQLDFAGSVWGGQKGCHHQGRVLMHGEFSHALAVARMSRQSKPT
jgi:hypothetical protein